MPAAEIGVVVIHGMGNPAPDFAAPLVKGLSRVLGADAAAVAFESCFWSDILQESQNEVWRRLRRSPAPLHLGFARQWVIDAFGDPTGYLSGYEQRGIPVLHKVHRCLAESIGRAERRLRDPARAPLVVLAHSLGCVVVTNYLWNIERAAGEVGRDAHGAPHAKMRPALNEIARKPIGDSPFERLETLAGLITFGCNIPLFLPPALPYECVAFPRPMLAPQLKRAARWLNVYDPYDVLGYPLNDLWDEKHGTVIDDVALEVGMPGLSMTPLSHSMYWSDAAFHELAGRELSRILAAAREWHDGGFALAADQRGVSADPRPRENESARSPRYAAYTDAPAESR